MAGIADVPFLAGWNQTQQLRDEQQNNQFRQVAQAASLADMLRKQGQEQAVRGILAETGGDPAKAIPALMKGGHIQAATQLRDQLIGQMNIEDMQKQKAWRESIPQFMSAGSPATPEQPLPEGIAGPPAPGNPAVPPSFDQDAWLQGGLQTGAIKPETYFQNKATNELRRATLQQTAANQMATLEERRRAENLRSEDRNLSREDRAAAADRSAELRSQMIQIQREIAASRQPRQLQLTVDAQGNQLMVNPDGTTKPLTTSTGEGVQKPVTTDKPMTEFQGKAALYGTRAAQSDKILKALEDKISKVGLALGQATKGFGGNFLLSSDQRRVDQAQRNFVNAILRQESGAVIADTEFDNAKKQYFPEPGDDEPVIAQKRANRLLAINGFKRMSGPKGGDEIQKIIEEPLLPGVQATNPVPKQDGVGVKGVIKFIGWEE